MPITGRFLVLDQKDKGRRAVPTKATYKINDKFSVTGGLEEDRHTNRHGNKFRDAYTQSAGWQPGGLSRGHWYAGSRPLPGHWRRCAEHAFVLGRKENSLTYSAGVQFEPNKDTLFYAKISSGFKAGGFNSFALSADPAEAEFEDERATGIEAGAKLKLFQQPSDAQLRGLGPNSRTSDRCLYRLNVVHRSECGGRDIEGIEIDGPAGGNRPADAQRFRGLCRFQI
ncbi:MAG: TonB-dependent receptor [Sphingomonadales bacterium]|nr:TonB-dependent receptor [Sphingomonadales bacterium]